MIEAGVESNPETVRDIELAFDFDQKEIADKSRDFFERGRKLIYGHGNRHFREGSVNTHRTKPIPVKNTGYVMWVEGDYNGEIRVLYEPSLITIRIMGARADRTDEGVLFTLHRGDINPLEELDKADRKLKYVEEFFKTKSS